MPSFLSSGGSFFQSNADRPVTVAAPATGSTYSMRAGQQAQYFNHTATVAALTVRLPPNPTDGDKALLKFGAAVTALLIQTSAGGGIPTAPVSVAVGQSVEMVYVNSTVGWVWW